MFSFETVVTLEKDYNLTHYQFVEIVLEWIINNTPSQDMVTQLWGMFRQQELCWHYLDLLCDNICQTDRVSVLEPEVEDFGDDKYKYYSSVITLDEGQDLSCIKINVNDQCKKCKKEFSLTVRLVEGSPCYTVEAGDAHIAVEHAYLMYEHVYDLLFFSLLTNSYSTVVEKVNEVRRLGIMSLGVVYTCTTE